MKIPAFKLERFFAKYEFKAPYLLCSSDCESMSINELLSMSPGALNGFKKLKLGYTESSGNPKLKEEISKLYSNTRPQQILVLAGAEEGIFIFMNTALKKDDHIIVQFPGYQSLYEIANSIGCKVTKWRMRNDYSWNTEVLKRSITKKTKAIIINNPHNPTGTLMDKGQLNEIISLCRRHDLYLFSDEVYQGLELDTKDRLPSICDIYKKGISLGVMSKTYGLAGLRIGWIATKDRSLLSKIASFKDYTSICNSAPSEFLSIIALQNKEKIVARNLRIINHNLNLLDTFFNKYPQFQWQRPKASSIAFPRISKDSERFCLDLVKKQGVLLLPSTHYDFGNKHFRVGFGRKNLPAALKRLETYLN